LLDQEGQGRIQPTLLMALLSSLRDKDRVATEPPRHQARPQDLLTFQPPTRGTGRHSKATDNKATHRARGKARGKAKQYLPP
jgi:hypothetical protein